METKKSQNDGRGRNRKPRGARKIVRRAGRNNNNIPTAKNGNTFESNIVAAPVAMSRVQRNAPPSIFYAKDGTSCRVKHRERIGTILGSVGFAVNSQSINPGLFASFPWLSAIAQRFESYRFNSLRYEYRTKSATTGTGDVILTVDFDAAEAAPVSSIQAEAYKSSVACAPWQDVNWVASPSDLHKLNTNYVRSGALAANLDLKTYDIGNLFVCTENQASAALVGYIYVEYDVQFLTPELSADAAPVIYAGRVTGATAQTAANPFGTAPSVDPQSLGFSMDATSTLTIAVVGEYFMALQYTGTVITAVLATNVVGATVASQSGFNETLNAAATAGVEGFRITTTQPNATIILTATATTITGANLVISKFTTGMLT